MPKNGNLLRLSSACAAIALLAGPAAAKMVSQTGSPFEASGSIDSGNFNEDDETLAFDLFDPSLGTLTGVTLDYDLSSEVAGSFDYAGQGGGWDANTVVVIDWDEGDFNREDGDGGGGNTSGSDSFSISASLSGTETPDEELPDFVGDGQTDVFLKYVVSANGGPGTFDADYSFKSSVTLTYEYDEASGGGGTGGGDDGGTGGGGGDDGGGTGGGDDGGVGTGGGGGDHSGGGTGPTPPPAPIPLPAGLPLLLGGLGALGLARRFRRG